MSNSVFWGQVDSIVLFFLLAALLSCINQKYSLVIFFTLIGQAVKPVVILTLPFYLMTILRSTKFKRKYHLYIIPVLIYLLIFLPFSNNNIFRFIIEKNLLTAGFWRFTTLNAFNFWLVITTILNGKFDLISDQTLFIGIPYSLWGYILFSLVYLIIFISWIKRRVLKSAEFPFLINNFFLIYLSLFHFFTRMHERHSYYALGFGMLVFALTKNKLKKVIIILLNVIYLMNMVFSYYTASNIEVFSQKQIFYISAINMILFTILLMSKRTEERAVFDRKY